MEEPRTAIERTSPERYHALDSLRGVMMLLGIYLHACVAYSDIGGWPWKDAARTSAFDLSIGFIHVFRMPVFYVMAGFFSALLYFRRGPWGFLENRLKRVGIPFIAGWLALAPVVAALSVYGNFSKEPGAIRKVVEHFSQGWFFRNLHPLHLWFLEYLLLFYPIALAAAWLWPRLAPSSLSQKLNGLFRRALVSPARPLIFFPLTFLTLCLMNQGFMDDPPSFIPQPKLILAYLVFFGFGWLLYPNADLLPLFQRHAWKSTVLSLVPGFLCWHLIELQNSRGSGGWAFFASAASYGLALWLLLFGLTGLFLRYLDRPRPRMRYLSDSSYWLYLAHMPVLIVLQLILALTDLPPAVKAMTVLLASVPILLASYDLWVRPGFIGAILNGRRYPRMFFNSRGGQIVDPRGHSSGVEPSKEPQEGNGAEGRTPCRKM